MLKTVNKNTKTVYDFYVNRLTDPKLMKRKNVCLIAVGNARYIAECKQYAKSVLVLESVDCSSFVYCDFSDINSLSDKIENWLKTHKMKKFDLIVMNPPYNTPLCYDIYENVRCKANETVYIGPIQTVYTSLLSDSNCKFYSTDITYMPLQKMNELFNIGIRMECGIVYANMSATANIEQYKKFWPAMKLFKSIRAKIHDKLNFHLENEPKGKFHIRVFDGCKWDPINGGAALDYNYAIKDNKVGHVKYVNLFNSENERHNFYDTCNNSIFTKFLMKFTNRKDIPYMQDYSQPWTDKRFCDYFKITGYVSDTEAVPGSEWETILNSVK